MGRFEDALKKAAKERKRTQKDQFEIPKTSELNNSNIKLEPHLITHTQQKSFFADQYQSLRINIERKFKHKKSVSILLTSSSRGEGKTTTSINLAITLSRDIDTERVLLIDGDIRKPSISSIFKLGNETGLTDVLLNKATLDQAINKDIFPKIDILSSGKVPENPTDLIHTKKLVPIFEFLNQNYEWILIDSSPILLFSDSLSFVEVVNGIVFVIRSEKTSKPVIQRAIDTFPHDKILGYVINHVEYPIPNFI